MSERPPPRESLPPHPTPITIKWAFMDPKEYDQLQKDNEERFWNNQSFLPDDGTQIVLLGYGRAHEFDQRLNELINEFDERLSH